MKPLDSSPRYPLLSSRELEHLLGQISAKLIGARVERIFVPELKAHPEQYFKREWVFDLHSERDSFQLFLSLRPQACAIFLCPQRNHRPASKASRSGFDLSLSKSLEGSKLTHIEMIKNERAVKLSFQSHTSFELVVSLIPSSPWGVLFEKGSEMATTLKACGTKIPEPRELTDAQLEKIPYREEWVTSSQTFSSLFLKAREHAALTLRKSHLEKRLQTEAKSIEGKIRSLEIQLDESNREPDWLYYGNLLKIHFHEKPKMDHGIYLLLDYEKDEVIKVQGDPKLELKAQLDRFFHLAKRNKKRLEETALRIQSLNERLQRTNALSLALSKLDTLNELLKWEEVQGLAPVSDGTLKPKEQKKLLEFSGPQYRSEEGLTILVGRNSTENLELTFKIARGNDLWLHVKGRPGSHAIIILPPKRSASLETLLDAAQVCVLHSGGKEWGKTEVDYTYRKNVKKIKNQTEVSYTHNKTLMVSVEPERMKRLFPQT